MGLRIRKSINLGGGARINLSKSGIGGSFGVKGFRATKMSNGRTRTTASIPGTGISYVKESGKKRKNTSNLTKTNTYEKKDFILRKIKSRQLLYLILTIVFFISVFQAPGAIIFAVFFAYKWNKYRILSSKINCQNSLADSSNL